MARLVARALRLGRSALIQVGSGCGHQGRYRLSYLAPALIWPGPIILVVTQQVQQRLLRMEIPPLQQWLQTNKGIRSGDRWPNADFRGLLLTSPEAWLAAQLEQKGEFPTGIPTIIDGVDDLEDWTRSQLTASIQPSDWDELMLACPEHIEAIRDARVQVTRAVYQRPANPYECYWIPQPEQEILRCLYELGGRCTSQVASALSPIWSRQPVVLVGSALDQEAEAPIYRQRVGLSDVTCLKFSADRHNELIQLYLPDKLPLPNTPQFQAAFVEKVRSLLYFRTVPGLTVVLVGDTPLKSQVGAVLAAEFGSRVQVEKSCLDDNGILVSGWEFWRQSQSVLPAPQVLVIATLPLPSLEDPLVAGRVAYYKKTRQDWFRLYLLPAALSELQRAIAPVRERQGVVALLDARVVHRSYGSQVLAALSPLARINYLDASLFSQSSDFNSESVS